jgi:uncharacterized membrane protein YqiK
MTLNRILTVALVVVVTVSILTVWYNHNRYQIVHTENALYRLDTNTGQVWITYAFPKAPSKPFQWQLYANGSN